MCPHARSIQHMPSIGRCPKLGLSFNPHSSSVTIIPQNIPPSCRFHQEPVLSEGLVTDGRMAAVQFSTFHVLQSMDIIVQIFLIREFAQRSSHHVLPPQPAAGAIIAVLDLIHIPGRAVVALMLDGPHSLINTSMLTRSQFRTRGTGDRPPVIRSA